MNKQREILPDAVAFVRRHAPDCHVCLTGSLNFGGLRPDSDIDFVVVTARFDNPHFPDEIVEWEEPAFRLVRVNVADMPVHIHLFPCSWFSDLESRPWRGYTFTKMEVLHDPDGMMRKCQAKIAPWFADHPEIVEVWQSWMAERNRRNMSRGLDQGELIRRFPDGAKLWGHLDELMMKEEDAEPSLRALPRARGGHSEAQG